MTAPPLSLDGIERWAGSQPGKVFSVLLQPLIQCPGLGVEPQGQFDVPVGFQGIETEHVGQVLGAREAKLLIVLRVCLKVEGGWGGRGGGICEDPSTSQHPAEVVGAGGHLSPYQRPC